MLLSMTSIHATGIVVQTVVQSSFLATSPGQDLGDSSFQFSTNHGKLRNLESPINDAFAILIAVRHLPRSSASAGTDCSSRGAIRSCLRSQSRLQSAFLHRTDCWELRGDDLRRQRIHSTTTGIVLAADPNIGVDAVKISETLSTSLDNSGLIFSRSHV